MHIDKRMLVSTWRFARYGLLALLLLTLFFCRMCPGEEYAQSFYPTIACLLGNISSTVPISLDELLVVGIFLFWVSYPVVARRCLSRSWKHILRIETESVLWIVCWFYWGWGLNYMRDDFYARMKLDRHVTESDFRDFAEAYTRSLNESYVSPDSAMPERITEGIIQCRYALLPAKAGLVEPTPGMTPKYLIFNGLYSKVGVLGFMGPFFAEIHVNHDLLPLQYPFTYAHELAHRLSVSSEAEANFWAYNVCTRSSDAWIRYSGYMGIFPYVRSELRRRLSTTEYRLWLGSVRSEVLDQQSAENRHWNGHYSPWLGAVQHALYNSYLKGNKVSAGTRNYAQVIAMIVCCRKALSGSSGRSGTNPHPYMREDTVVPPR